MSDFLDPRIISNERIALAYAETNPMPEDCSLDESLRINLPPGYSQEVTVTPETGYVLYITDIQVDNYTLVKYTFVIGNITYDNTNIDRGSALHFVKPMKVGEGDKVYIKVYNGEASTIKFNISVQGWARDALNCGGAT